MDARQTTVKQQSEGGGSPGQGMALLWSGEKSMSKFHLKKSVSRGEVLGKKGPLPPVETLGHLTKNSFYREKNRVKEKYHGR